MKFLLGFLLIHLFILFNLNYTAWPEMFSYPYLFSSGYALYKDFVMPYPPILIIVLTTVFKIFGFNILVLKLLTWGLILLVDLLVFLILRQIVINLKVAYFLLFVFIILQSILDGNQLWFDFATVLPLLLSMYFFISWFGKKELKYLILVGVFLSITILTKQIGLIYVLGFGLMYLVFSRGFKFNEVLNVLLGFMPGFLLFASYLLVTNTFWDFWNWGIYYPISEWSKFPGYTDLEITRREVLIFMGLLLPLGFSIFAFKKLLKSKEFLLSIAILICAIVAIYPRFSYFHLQPMIALSVICYGVIASELKGNILVKYLTVISVVVILIVLKVYPGVIGYQSRFYTASEIQTAELVRSLTQANEKVYLLGLHSSIYVFANRLPAKPWVDNFGWYLEIPGVQENILKQFENNPPKLILHKIPQNGEWFGLSTYRAKEISGYMRKNYNLVEVRDDTEIWIRKD